MPKDTLERRGGQPAPSFLHSLKTKFIAALILLVGVVLGLSTWWNLGLHTRHMIQATEDKVRAVADAIDGGIQIAMREGVGSQQQVDAAVAASRREEFDLGNAAVASLARELSMRYADRHDLYCGEGAGCRILWLDGRTVLWDAAHLTVFGMEQTARRVAELGWLEPPAGR